MHTDAYPLEPSPTYPPTIDEIRRRALERLYSRKAAVDDLIRSLENYQRVREAGRAPVITLTADRQCW